MFAHAKPATTMLGCYRWLLCSQGGVQCFNELLLYVVARVVWVVVYWPKSKVSMIFGFCLVHFNRKIIILLSSICCMVWCINYVCSTNGVGKCMLRFILGVWGLLRLIELPNNKNFYYHKYSTKPLRAYVKQVCQDTGTGLLVPSDAWVKWIWRPHLHPCHSRHFISVMENIELQSHYSLNTSPVNHRTPPTDAWRWSRLWTLATPLSARRSHKLLSPEP